MFNKIGVFNKRPPRAQCVLAARSWPRPVPTCSLNTQTEFQFPPPRIHAAIAAQVHEILKFHHFGCTRTRVLPNARCLDREEAGGACTMLIEFAYVHTLVTSAGLQNT